MRVSTFLLSYFLALVAFSAWVFRNRRALLKLHRLEKLKKKITHSKFKKSGASQLHLILMYRYIIYWVEGLYGKEKTVPEVLGLGYGSRPHSTQGHKSFLIRTDLDR